jgi:cytidine deaminase
MNEIDPNAYIEQLFQTENPDELTQEAIIAAMLTSKNTYSPYSKFPVGAAVVTEQEIVFSGCNVENASYGITLCAERNAITTMIATLGPNAKINEVIIYTPTIAPSAPCGACRQVIREFAVSLDNTVVRSYAINPHTKPIVLTINQLLPESL